MKSVRKSIREDLCKGCIYWKPIDGATKNDCVCPYCYVEGHPRRKDSGTCMEYQRREKRGRKCVSGAVD